jgi:hypothetical protein
MPLCECNEGLGHEAALLREVTWPDGRKDRLPSCCDEADLPPQVVVESLEPIAHIAYWDEGGFPGAYVSASLAKVPAASDIYLLSCGDIDEDQEGTYLRGSLREALREWLDSSTTSHLPVEAVILATHYGLLAGVDDYEGAHPVNLFLHDTEAAPFAPTLMISVNLKTSSELSDELTSEWEQSGLTWPRDAANPGTARDAWLRRLDSWLTELQGHEEDTHPPTTWISREEITYLLGAHGLKQTSDSDALTLLRTLSGHTDDGCSCDPSQLHELLQAIASAPLPPWDSISRSLNVHLTSERDDIPAVTYVRDTTGTFLDFGGEVWAMPDALTAALIAARIAAPVHELEVQLGDAAEVASVLMAWGPAHSSARVRAQNGEMDWSVHEDGILPAYALDSDGISGFRYEFVHGTPAPGASRSGYGVLIPMHGRYWAYVSDPGEWTLLAATTEDTAKNDFDEGWVSGLDNEYTTYTTW